MPAAIVGCTKSSRMQVTAEMSSLTAIWNFLWTHRKYWKGPITVMVVVAGILFGISLAARIIPYFSHMF